MNTAKFYTRREFMQTGLAGVATALTVPIFLKGTMSAVQAANFAAGAHGVDGRAGPILVVVQLSGGNDGLNTVVPFTNDHYHRERPVLRLKPDEVLKLDAHFGFHPAMIGLKGLLDDGLATVVHGVGYPNPNRSHFRSMEIWHTASDADQTLRHGWIGRYFDNACSGCDSDVAVNIGRGTPQAFSAASPMGMSFQHIEKLPFEHGSTPGPSLMEGEDQAGSSIGELSGGHRAGEVDPLGFIERTAMQAEVGSERIRNVVGRFKPSTRFPENPFGRDLFSIAQLIGGGMPARIYYASLGGFDTHANQVGAHRNLLATFSTGVEAFMREMKMQGNQERVLVLAFSEFGRRVKENGSRGTDHGAAAPCFLFGGKVRRGLVGDPPDLDPSKLSRGDLVHTVDFRSIYAGILENHLGVSSRDVLGSRFDVPEIFQQARQSTSV